MEDARAALALRGKSYFREVRYTLLDQPGEARLLVAGPRDAKQMVYFQPGFPDTQQVFLELAMRVANDGALVGVGCLPEYDRQTPLRREGYDLDEMTICFGQAVAALREASTAANAQLTLVTHDFSTTPCALWTERSLAAGSPPAKVVYLDVLPGSEAAGMWSLVQHNYQAFFGFSFWLHWRVSDILAKLFLVAGLTLMLGVLGRWLNPINPKLDVKYKKTIPFSMKPYVLYPYYHAIKEGVNERLKPALPPLDRVQVLYLWGELKNTMFHDERGLAALAGAKGSKAVGMSGSGHYLFRHDQQQAQECFAELKKFLES